MSLDNKARDFSPVFAYNSDVKWIIRIAIVTIGIPSLAIGLLMLARFRPGRGHVSSAIDINRPAADVFRWISRPELMEQWFGGISEITRISPAGDAERIGDRFRAVEIGRDQASPTNLTITVTEIVPDRRFGIEIVSFGDPTTSFTEEAKYRLSEMNGTTHVVVDAQTTFQGKLSQSFEPFITSAAKKKFQHDLERLKALVEVAPAANSH
ncbi:MAG: SRPBCC family protein [Candidatus Acidiferrales bacterium]